MSMVQVRGEAQALRAEMETQRTRATQLEQLCQQQVTIGSSHCMQFTLSSNKAQQMTLIDQQMAAFAHDCSVYP